MLALSLLLAACGQREQSATPQPSNSPSITARTQRPILTPEEILESQLRQTPPSRDLLALHQRLRGELPGALPSRLPQDLQVGEKRSFWIADHQSKGYSRISATLRYSAPDVYFFVEDGRDVSDDDIESAAVTFSGRIAPQMRQYFGSESSGADEDRHIVILHASFSGPPGYFSSTDEYPASINPYSNESKMIYINLRNVSPGSPRYFSILAHEFQHMIHWNNDLGEDAWVNEGLSELASRLAGYTADSLPSFVSAPDTQLDAWDENSARAVPHYGASYAFFSYLAERFGGYQALKELVKNKKHGAGGVEDFLRHQGDNVSFDDVFKDWVVANLLDDRDLDGGRYGYQDLDVKINPQKPSLPYRTATGVHQYAAQYLELPPGDADLDIVFTGTTRVKLVPNNPHSGKAEWWSNRGDVMDTTLTRGFDLTGLDRATLKAWLWYDIEKDFDYAYVETSADEGQTWTILSGKHTTTLNPTGNSFGPAYTGKSGAGGSPSWIEDEFDLTPHAGKRVQVRFEYVTDDANNGDGFLVDDVSISELGYLDDSENEGGWTADGFIRSDNYVRQNLAVQLVKRGRPNTVQTLPLEPGHRGHWRIKASDLAGQRAILVISAMASTTTQRADFELTLDKLPTVN